MSRFTWLPILLLATAAIAAEPNAFDRISSSYQPFMDANDPLAFPVKVMALANSPYKFWRGSKDLYNDWCKTHAADWIADKDSWLTSHGDIHFGNIGSYPAGKWGELRFGLVDFDEVCRCPMQIEVMQGLITVALTAKQSQRDVTADQQAELCQILIDAYKQGLTSPTPADELLADDSFVKKTLEDAGKSYKKKELDKLAPDGHFVTLTFTKEGTSVANVKDVHRPAMAGADEFAAGIEQAIGHSPAMASMFRVSDRASIRAAIKDAVQRTRIDSSGSQGLKKYLILLDHPLKDRDHDLVLYLKQEIPTAAQRAGVGDPDRRTPGQRVATDSAALSDAPLLINSWCELGNESYWVTLKEPWSNELDPGLFFEFFELKSAARIWGMVTGCSHRKDSRAAALSAKLTPEVASLIRERSDAYLKELDADYFAFTHDPRTAEARLKAARAIAEQYRLGLTKT